MAKGVPPSVVFGERVRALRTARGLSQIALGEIAGLHFTYVSSVERGLRNVTLASIIKIAEALDEDPGALITGLAST